MTPASYLHSELDVEYALDRGRLIAEHHQKLQEAVTSSPWAIGLDWFNGPADRREVCFHDLNTYDELVSCYLTLAEHVRLLSGERSR